MNCPDKGIMTRFEREAHSFVIRIWRENREEKNAPDVLRGWITHVQSERRHYFQDVADIKPIIASYLTVDTGLEDVFEPVQGDNESE